MEEHWPNAGRKRGGKLVEAMCINGRNTDIWIEN